MSIVELAIAILLMSTQGLAARTTKAESIAADPWNKINAVAANLMKAPQLGLKILERTADKQEAMLLVSAKASLMWVTENDDKQKSAWQFLHSCIEDNLEKSSETTKQTTKRALKDSAQALLAAGYLGEFTSVIGSYFSSSGCCVCKIGTPSGACSADHDWSTSKAATTTGALGEIKVEEAQFLNFDENGIKGMAGLTGLDNTVQRATDDKCKLLKASDTSITGGANENGDNITFAAGMLTAGHEDTPVALVVDNLKIESGAAAENKQKIPVIYEAWQAVQDLQALTTETFADYTMRARGDFEAAGRCYNSAKRVITAKYALTAEPNSTLIETEFTNALGKVSADLQATLYRGLATTPIQNGAFCDSKNRKVGTHTKSSDLRHASRFATTNAMRILEQSDIKAGSKCQQGDKQEVDETKEKECSDKKRTECKRECEWDKEKERRRKKEKDDKKEEKCAVKEQKECEKATGCEWEENK
ncbi:Trypanosome variant surface glycoprotein (A-type), putative [Trypanosoma equiperdum]|uniref:Trypanosome variant surface glycoprotein (A-type), putative n=1 Tax=Trypanosoma equiperdum TaxID=5694 RepID=A0A1G4IGY1_TRYEQ|nr:Trypanosome variant surface glycoprotein (A-type), putative [Trypanosoma equiperdum]